MADYGIKVSKEGFDTKTAEPYEQVIKSSYSMLKVSSQGNGSLSFTTSDSSKIATIAHNLGYIPVFHVYLKRIATWATFTQGTKYSKTTFVADYYVDGVLGVYTAYADDTNIYIKVDFGATNAPAIGDIDYYYIIYTDEK